MTESNGGRPRVLIEDWLPVAELGIESRRERAAVHALPPLSFLHVWWARRPLVASAAVILAGLLPAWTPELGEKFIAHPELRDERAYHCWLLRLVGIWGDPVAAKRVMDAANLAGTKVPGSPFGYKQAYRNAIARADVDLLHEVLVDTWGALPLVADPTAGGGSIPFAATRLGLPTFANDLNGVAAAILMGGVRIPAVEGPGLTQDLKHWGNVLTNRVREDLSQYFPMAPGEEITAYVWACAVDCPRTGRLVPLMPDMWLRKEKGKEAAVRIVSERDGQDLSTPEFAVLLGSQVDLKAANQGTISRGDAVSPYDNLVIDGDYIKSEAQAGRLRQVLYALAIKTSSGQRTFRAPTAEDLDAIAAATLVMSQVKSDWTAHGFIPDDEFPEGNDKRPRNYGMTHWADFYTPRQLLAHGTFSKHFALIVPEVREALGERADDVLLLLALMQGKALNYNTRQSRWQPNRSLISPAFERHDFSFKWTFAEMAGPAVYGWALEQVLKVYPEVAALLDETGSAGVLGEEPIPREVTVTQGSASNLTALPDGAVAHVCMDPPYYDNVMYAELSDFFYAWEKHTLGALVPDFFRGSLADKENEAVANVARFEAMGKRKRELAELDYEAKMTGIFAECRRVLRDDGVLSVMFTHKRAEAWDTLGMGLLQAGFTVETSWPVNTESEHSLHQANMNSAASTIMLVCRKRVDRGTDKVFLDDLESEIRLAARDAVTKFIGYGIDGVDLLLSTYGPVLAVISAHWPVYSPDAGEGGRSRLLRPEEALTIAREEVVRLQRQRIVGHDVKIDNHSDFVMIAWETFKAFEFSFDEARRLALAVGGLEMDELARAKVLTKKSGTVRLLSPKERVRRGGDDSATGVRIDATKFEYMNDALDTVLYVAEVDGMSDAKVLMDRLGLTGDQRFLAYVQGLVNAMPRVKVKGEWVLPEAGLLDTLVTAYLPDITLPAEPEVEIEDAPTLFD